MNVKFFLFENAFKTMIIVLRRGLLLGAFLFSQFSYAFEVVQIKGAITDERGLPVTIGHIHIGNPEHRSLSDVDQRLLIPADGKFSITIKKGIPLFIHFTSPNHTTLTVLLPPFQKEVLDMEVVLPRLALADDNMFMPVLLPIPSPGKKDTTKVTGTKASNGSYVFDLSSIAKPVFSYQVDGVSSTSLISAFGDSTSLYVPTSTGFGRLNDYYYSTIDLTKRKAIEIDFNDLLTLKELDPIIRTDDSVVNTWIKVNTMAVADFKRITYEMSAYAKINGTTEGFDYQCKTYYESLLKIYKSTKDRNLKNLVLAKLSFLMIGNKYPVDQKYILEAIEEISPSDYLWVVDGYFLNGVFKGLGEFKKNKYLLVPFIDSLIEYCPIRSEKPRLLYFAAYNAREAELNTEFNKYFESLVNNFPESRHAGMALKQLGSKLTIIKGAKFPDFTIFNIDKPEEFITNETLKDKIYLIDFWATWCSPCIKQFPYIQNAYEKYKNKGLEVLSVSTDRELKLVENFRKKKWAMPWMNGFMGGEREVLDRFEVFAIPKMILVDKDGIILSVSRNELEGENLDKTLDKHFSLR